MLNKQILSTAKPFLANWGFISSDFTQSQVSLETWTASKGFSIQLSVHVQI